MKIVCCQLNPIVGDVDGNLERAKSAIIAAEKQNPDIILFTELFLTGYPPRDLLFRSDVVSQNITAKDALVKLTENIKPAIAFGYVERNLNDGGKGLFNAVCVAQNGRILQQRYKTLLPTYDVFEERRYFEPGPLENIQPVEINGVPFGIIICEEAWNDKQFWTKHEYDFDPVEVMVQRGAKYILSINASPFRVQDNAPIVDTRIQMIQKHATKHGVGCIYVNQVGANDEIIFDGNSFAIDSKGILVSQAMPFSTDLMTVDISVRLPELPAISYKRPVQEHLLQALICGVRDYFDKQPVFQQAPAFIGLSGGIDSALTAYIAVQALGISRVIGVSMPREGISSDGSKSDATKLANALGIRCITMPIGMQHGYARTSLDDANSQLWMRNTVEKAKGLTLFNKPLIDCINAGVTDENQQARIRGLNLMSLANYYNGIVLTTGNKSEMAVGYCTLYGDMCGGLAVISDLYKGGQENPEPTSVYGLCRYINEFTRQEIIPWDTINKPPSAELRVNQTDQQSLPPYTVLDAILKRFVDEQKPVEEIHKELSVLFDAAEYTLKTDGRKLDADINWACNAVLRNEYKRKQGAPGLKVSPKHWKYGWHMPIVHKMKVG